MSIRSSRNWRIALAFAALASVAAPEAVAAADAGTTPKGKAAQPNSSPPPKDSDRDGVPDKADKCPLAPGPADADGCPKAVRVDLAIGQIVLLQPIEFAPNKDTILEEGAPVLEEVRATLAANPQFARVRIEGHTDARGSNHKNLDLSARRAESVRAWLVAHGVSSNRLLSSGCGSLYPIATNKTDEGRQRNWRIELHIVSDDIDIRTGCIDASS